MPGRALRGQPVLNCFGEDAGPASGGGVTGGGLAMHMSLVGCSHGVTVCHGTKDAGRHGRVFCLSQALLCLSELDPSVGKSCVLVFAVFIHGLGKCHTGEIRNAAVPVMGGNDQWSH